MKQAPYHLRVLESMHRNEPDGCTLAYKFSLFSRELGGCQLALANQITLAYARILKRLLKRSPLCYNMPKD
jgi:hypothetical protein